MSKLSDDLVRYDLLKQIGKGTQGNVYLVKHRPEPGQINDKPDQYFAMKVIDKRILLQKDTEQKRLKSEIKCQHLLS